ncbi:MAG: sodium/glutamate symporter [Bacteroidales bacterium]|nr:sodium/glutamate symporter [Bacteroidales bacterium]
MTALNLDMFQSAGAGVLALLLGRWLTRRIPFLQRYCIPLPVSGGLAVSLACLCLYGIWDIECVFDGTVKDFCMTAFFTAAGFLCDMKMIRSGGRPLLVMLLLVALLIIAQNGIAVGLACALGRDPLFGMAVGSIPMCGGHGTSAGFAPLLGQHGLAGASSLTMAAATFGLIAGSLLGGPLADAIIRHRKPADLEAAEEKHNTATVGDSAPGNDGTLLYTLIMLMVAMALGSALNTLLSRAGISCPAYFGSMIVAIVLRNTAALIPSMAPDIRESNLRRVAEIFLGLFLGMAMASLRLWELKSMALPLTVILLVQVSFMALYAWFVAYPLLGKDYEGVVLVSGLCGFGLGATPNAMANMEAVCTKYRPAVRPFLIIPLIGGMFLDILNIGIITLTLNII